MTDYSLSKQQIQVVAALSEGVTTTDAAALAGVHRNTIAYWRRNSPPFAHALSHAQYDRALYFRENADMLVELAFVTLEAILNDPKASPAVRLKASLYIIDMATTPPPPKKQVSLDIEKISYSTTHVPTAAPAANTPETTPEVHNEVHNSAQSEPPKAPAPVQTIRRDHPKIGRSEPCPCKSGRKFKQCCLNKPQTAAPAKAA